MEAVAAKLLAYVKAKPGQRLEEIGRGVGVETAGLKLPVQVLFGTGRLRTEGQKRGTRYFAGSKGGSAKAKVVSAKGSGRKAGTPAASKVVKQVAVKPATTARMKTAKGKATPVAPAEVVPAT